MNIVVLKGNMTRDPELRYTGSGKPVANFTLAVNRKYKDSSGELQEEVAFVDCTSWNAQAEALAEHTGKGSALLVEGRIKQESWENDAGEKRSKLVVICNRIDFVGKPKGETE